MSKDLEVILRGTQAEAAARELEIALGGDGAPLTLARRPATERDVAGHRALDPVAVTGLLLSIPSALLAVWDLADRIRKRRTAQTLVEQAGRLRIERGVESWVLTLEGPRALDRLTADQLLELVSGQPRDADAGRLG